MRYLLQYTGKQIDALLDKVNSGSVIESVEKTDDGYDVTLTDGTVISLKNGDKGEQGEQGIQGPQGPKGETGVSITDITQTVISTDDEGINVVTVTKSDGDSQSFQVRNGSKGSTGAKGFSPIVKIAEIDGGHRITITDSTSVQSFDVLDGKDSESIVFDTAMSDSSEKAVQNRVIKAYVDDAVANVEIDVDSAMSGTSTNPVQNKVVKAELDKKVDAVSGKQLSTEDFTSALKDKLEGLSNYDDTEIIAAVTALQSQIDTLVSGDASTAIESFNEIIAFLNGVEDTESLDSIIASIEQQIADKQDVIEDLATIREGAALGMTALQEHQDISHLATKEEVTNLQNEVIANEEVVAAAFNDVNERINAISENVSGTTVTKEEFESTVETINQTISDNKSATDTAIEGLETSIGNVDAKFANYATTESLNDAIETINNTIVDNEEVTAAAFNDINSRISSCATLSDLDAKQDALVSGTNIKTINNQSLLGSGNITIEGGGGGGGVAELMTETTYADLVALRDAGNLVAGQKYRIIDYETKTSKAGSQSAGHLFDIIVTALDGSTLDEKASAIQSARDADGYFVNSKLEAWEVWYCLDNDTDRFNWAVKAGTFLIVDLSELELGSIQAVPNGTFEYEGTTYYRWDVTMMGLTAYILTINASPAVGESTILYDPSGDFGMPAGTVISLTESTDNGFGVVYRLIDERQNDVPYDFKNMQFVRKITDGALDLENGTDTWCYTFSDFSTGVLLDASESRSTIFGNKFALHCWDNVFLGTICSYNTFGNDCDYNSFGDNFYSNTFGDSCYSNTFGNSCSDNTFGNRCSDNAFGASCYRNTFEFSCNYNSFEDNCSYNTFGNRCNYNTFGDSCSDNAFGASCYRNTFRDSCRSNTFGTNCGSNTFGSRCSYNTFGDSCHSNTFATASDGSAIANSCSYNTLGQNCSYNIIWIAFGNIIQYIELKSGIYGTDVAKLAIEIPVAHANYVQTVAKNSSGEIKIYCEADLI